MITDHGVSHKTGKANESSSGFTLMEIVIALLVLSLVAITSIKASGNSVNNIHYLKQRTFAHWVAMNKAAEIMLAPQGWEQAEKNGVTLMVDGEWPWSFSVHDTPETGIRRVEIRAWPEGGKGEPAALLDLYRRR